MSDDLAAAFRGKQTFIPGTEPDTSPELEEAADRLREAEAAVKAAQEVKATRGEALVFAMQNASVSKYRYTDSEGRSWVVRLKRKDRVVIKRAGADDDDARDNGGS
ncbi:MAG TPA: hypothetical protein VG994_02765 [Steroidobacteraceae bacterium]|nr:hypothetical protein [Steroidobacteraceae bacterium]